jgi:hypothetical protein
MRAVPLIIAVFALAASSAVSAATATKSPTAVLSAYRAASGGDGWRNKTMMRIISTMSVGNATASSITVKDLRSGQWVAHKKFGQTTTASGFDGSRPWTQDTSGVVSVKGGDALALAVDDAYVNANLWWRPNFDGAKVLDIGKRPCGSSTCSVLRITPEGGVSFLAWFDVNSNMLVRLSRRDGARTSMEYLSDYRNVDGVRVPFRKVVNQGIDRNINIITKIESVNFLRSNPKISFSPPKAQNKSTTIANGATRTTFPFNLLGNNIYANVRLNGSQPLLFLLDTGGQNVIFPSTANLLGIHVNWVTEHNGSNNTGVGAVDIRSLDIGGARLAKQIMIVRDLFPYEITGMRVCGTIGAAVFRAFVTRFDYTTHQITLIRPDQFHPQGAGTPIRFELIGDMPAIRGDFDGIPGKFVIDTGQTNALMLTSPFVAEHHLQTKNSKGVMTIAGYGSYGNIPAYVIRAKMLAFGPFDLPNVVTAMSLAKEGSRATSLVQGMIGNGILKHFVVTLDYANSTAYFKPIGLPLKKVGNFNRSGLLVQYDARGFKVTYVIANSPAQQAGVEVGDIISTINGESANSLPIYKFMGLVRRSPPGTLLHLTIRRGKRTIQVALTLRNLIPDPD